VASQDKLLNTELPVSIGIKDVDKTSPLAGIIDEVRIYNRALTAEEIRALYGHLYEQVLKVNLLQVSHKLEVMRDKLKELMRGKVK